MSTIGYDSWAVDLAEVGAVYPFQGTETFMFILGLVFWIGWHRVQYVREGKHLDEARKMGDAEKVAKMLERY
ncbi:hypothetical protein QKW60_14850 [Defluviimonas aestuarii]|uniref:hypothetical protein n=1 Tax=Albidovulum aestuarii TaxID=1130726 RepID=UPI00249B76E9|nr:hypothetical protein [Defluviimonas aestuarii]MDI3337694.1 hypothetical protein [Defluviimonas aestuarii]